MKILGYEYQSCFAPYIKQFLQEKRSVGFSYETEEWKLKHFDDFCVKESVIQPYLSRELVKKWGTLREGEALSTCSARTSIIRQFALFMISSVRKHIFRRIFINVKKDWCMSCQMMKYQHSLMKSTVILQR